ncbi:bifunctional acetate--CoA ligase family protein/GNAT family N-acetyltransferase, partial [Methylobacterium gnaphalii]
PIGAARRAAREHSLRLLGPDSIGVAVPGRKLNASLLAHPPLAGDLALVTQSGTVASAIAAWAHRREVGFSAILTVGRSADVDVADALDHFAADLQTRAILLSLHRIEDARKFLSAARAAARVKPVMVLRTGRHEALEESPQTHTGALARPDAVYEAAFRRAGLLSVDTLDEMFSAAETLRRQRLFSGRRLMIVANGRGIGALAADRLAERGGEAADCAEATLEALAEVRHGSSKNPIDLGVDAEAHEYATALKPLLAARENDALLAIHVPTARARARETAEAIAAAVTAVRPDGGRRKPVFAVSVGESPAAAAVYAKAGIPLFPTDADAVDGFLHAVRYREAQDDLMRTPASLPQDFRPDVETARAIVEAALADGQSWLDPLSVKRLLGTYDIPMQPCLLAPDGELAAEAAWPMIAQGQPVALKLVSPDIVHKSDVGGVRLALTSEADVREAATRMIARVRAQQPEARITGFAVQAMVPRGTRRELIVGLAEDPTFGPVVVFGRGGTAVEVIDDRALGLPPLDLRLAADQIARTRVARRLAAYRDVPAADVDAIALVLVKLSQIAIDLPEVRELDINPLLADADGVLGVDGRVRVAPYRLRHSAAATQNRDARARAAGVPSTTADTVSPSSTATEEAATASPASRGDDAFSPPVGPGVTEGEPARIRATHAHLAIRPYPVEWERVMTLKGRPIQVRPVRPEDEGMFAAFFAEIDPEDVRLRFFTPMKHFSHAFLARLTQLDYARAIAFVAIDANTEQMLGAVRVHADANHESGEFGILVRSDIKGVGLGYALMRLMLDWARAEGIGRVEGLVLAENKAMLAVCRRLGFEAKADLDDPSVMKVTLAL